MCGISGIMYMNSGRNGVADVGSDLVKMLDALAHRGRDSTGFTVVGEQLDEGPYRPALDGGHRRG